MNTTTPPLWTDLQCPQHKDKGTVSCWVLLCQTYHTILSFQGTLEWIYKLSDTKEEEIWKLRIFNLLHIVMLNVPVKDSSTEETKILLIFKSCRALAPITGHWHPSLVAQFCCRHGVALTWSVSCHSTAAGPPRHICLRPASPAGGVAAGHCLGTFSFLILLSKPWNWWDLLGKTLS